MVKAFVDTSVILRILVKDDDFKRKASERLIKEAKQKEISLFLPSIVILETVWVLEKVYKLNKKNIKELVEAILNTTELKIEMEEVLRKAVEVYAEKNIKFADAVMGHWGLNSDITVVYSYDEKDFKRIEGLEVRKP